MESIYRNFVANFRYFVDTAVLLLILLNPVAIAVLFISMTGHYSRRQRESMARIACGVALGIFLVFAICGEGLLSLLGINLPALRIASGFLLAVVGLSMLRSEDCDAPAEGKPEPAFDRLRPNLAITPLAVPIIAGPRPIYEIILRSGEAGNWREWIALICAIFFALIVVYIPIFFAARWAKFLGRPALKLIFRIAGLVLLALAVQHILVGFEQLLAPRKLFGR
jgi:multiple antibiotic resistance protein